MRAVAHGLPEGTRYLVGRAIGYQREGQAQRSLRLVTEAAEAAPDEPDFKTQGEVDEFWEKLSQGGEEGPCGWLKDKYGLSWQINPTILGEMLQDSNPEKSKRVMEAMLKMKKIDIHGLQRAYESRAEG